MALGLAQVTKSFPQHKEIEWQTSQSSEKYRGRPMREECSTSFNEQNNFVLNSNILAELLKELKDK